MRNVVVVVVVLICTLLVAATLLCVRRWVRSLAMDMVDLLTDTASNGLLTMPPTSEPDEDTESLSLCVRLHAAHVQRDLLRLPRSLALVGFIRSGRGARLGVVLRKADCLHVVFRCACRLIELAMFLDIRRVPVASGGRVHRGVWTNFTRIVAPQLERLLGDTVDVHVSGYSMGGALAVCSALHLQWRHNVSLSIFAAPPVLDGAAIAALSDRVTVRAFVNRADRVATCSWGGLFVPLVTDAFHDDGAPPHSYGTYMRGVLERTRQGVRD
jgi:hypothetical protein